MAKQTITLTNLLTNPSFENTGWTANSACSVSYTTSPKHSGSYSLKVTSTSSSESLIVTSNTYAIRKNHIYYISVYFYETSNVCSEMQCYWPIAEPLVGIAKVDKTKLNQWQRLSWRNVRSNWNDNQTAQFRFDFEGMASNTIAYIDDAMLIDLTAAFGAGNEPTQSWCDTNIEYFAGNTTIQYEAPIVYDLTSTTPTRIKTGDILNCPYSGSVKSITLPKGQYKLECWGAQGGAGSYSSSGTAGKGGYSYGTLALSSSTTLYLYTGGQGGTGSTSASGGYNGGGSVTYSASTANDCGGGGGASHIATSSGLLSSLSSSTSSILLVAGGGGGIGWSWNPIGGYGGGQTGGNGSNYMSNKGNGFGGTQSSGGAKSQASPSSGSTTAGSFGQGGTGAGSSDGGAGGGGGYYGGGGATPSAGGGGSGYVNTSKLISAATIAGNTAFTSPTGTSETGHAGNGYIRITVIEASSGNTLVKIPQTLPSTYSPIEYLQFTGSQYIDTGAIVDSNTGFDITFEVLNGQSGSPYYNLFGVRGNDSSGGTGETQNFFRIDTIAVDSNSGTEFKYGSTVYNSGITNTSKINIKLVNKVYTKPNGSTITLSGNITSGLPMYIGCINKAGEAYGNKASMKLYRFKIYSGSTLTHDFIPVQRVSDKVLGLYDLKTSTFKTNLGSGVFTSNLMNDPSSLAYFNGDSLQSQGNLSLTITNNNVTLSNEQTHFGKKSLKFDGSSSYMYMPFPSTYTGDITIEGWFYQTSNNNNTYPTPFTLISSAGRGMYMHRLSSQTFVAATPSNSWPGLGGGTPALNTWTHIAMCLSGTTTYCFLDGKLKGTITDTNTSYVGLTLGTLAESASNNHTSGCYYKGYIAELKVSKGCKWTKDFTLPAAPYSTAKDSNPWKQPVQMFVNTGISTTIPSGLVELEYIESTGTQYIETGISAKNITKAVIDFQYITVDSSRENQMMSVWVDASNHMQCGLTGTTFLTGRGTTFSQTSNMTARTTGTSVPIGNPDMLIPLFAQRASAVDRWSIAKLYSCKMYNNSTIVRDFIPAKRISDGKCGLWDKVNFKFYTDENGGNFTAGAEKTAIAAIGTPIEYIQTSGTQYIDSGIYPTNNTRIITKLDFNAISSSTTNYVFGGATGSKNAALELGSVSNKLRFTFAGTESVYDFPSTKPFNIDINGNSIVINDGIKNTVSSATFTSTHTLYIGDTNRANTAYRPISSIKIYNFKIYNGNTLVRDFIPIKTAANIYGLWDKVNKVFYKNAGTGTFTAGPTVNLTGWHKIKGIWAKTAANTWSQAL